MNINIVVGMQWAEWVLSFLAKTLLPWRCPEYLISWEQKSFPMLRERAPSAKGLCLRVVRFESYIRKQRPLCWEQWLSFDLKHCLWFIHDIVLTRTHSPNSLVQSRVPKTNFCGDTIADAEYEYGSSAISRWANTLEQVRTFTNTINGNTWKSFT